MKQSPVNDPKIEEYGRYFNENLSKKQTGNLELLPERRFDLYPAALEFIARGGFQSPLKALSIKDDGIKDDGKERNKKYDVGKLFAPLTTHVKDGRILPFKTIDIGFYSTNVNDDELCPSIQELAKQIAAHPEAYYNLEQIKIKNQGNRRFDKGAYLNLLDELIKLAEDPKNPLSCAINITEVAALLAEYQNKGNQKKKSLKRN